MRCPDRKQLSAYVDQELTRSEMIIIGEHIKDCLSCRREVARMERLVSRLKLLAKEDLPIPAPIQRRQKTSFNWVAAVALLVIAIGSIVIISNTYETIAVKNWPDKEIEYYYVDHRDYIRSQSAYANKLTSWE